MNIMNLIKEHRYESVCVVLGLLLLAAVWPALNIGSEAAAKADKLRDLDSDLNRLRSPGPDGLANAALVEAKQQLAKQIGDEAEEVARLFKQRNKYVKT